MILQYVFDYEKDSVEIEVPWDYEVDEDDEELIKEFLESLPKEELDNIYSDIEEVDPDERERMKDIDDLIDYIEDIGVRDFLGDDYYDWLKDYYEDDAKSDFDDNFEYLDKYQQNGFDSADDFWHWKEGC